MNRLEQRFLATENHIDKTRQSYPAFPRESAVVVRLIKLLFSVLQDQTNSVLKPWGLSLAEYNLLMMLHGTEGHRMSPSELAEATGEKQANITRLIILLSGKELLERTPSSEDRRKAVVSLTTQGHQVINEFLPVMSQLLCDEMASLSELEQHMLSLLLKKMLTGLEGEEGQFEIGKEGKDVNAC